MDSTMVPNPDESKHYAYLRKGTVHLLAGANQWYNRRAYNEMREKHYLETDALFDAVCDMKRFVKDQRRQIQTLKHKLREIHDTSVAFRSMHEMYMEKWTDNQDEGAELLKRIRDVEAERGISPGYLQHEIKPV